MLLGLRETDARRIEEVRRDGPFRSLDDFVRRTKLSRAVVSLLSEADAFGSLEMNRRYAMWQALALDRRPDQTPLFDESRRRRNAADPAAALRRQRKSSPIIERPGFRCERIRSNSIVGSSRR